MNNLDEMEETDKAWLGGILSFGGNFLTRAIISKKRAGRELSDRLEFYSRKHEEALVRATSIIGVPMKDRMRGGVRTPGFTLWGDDLKAVMLTIWPYLTKERQKEWVAVRRASNASVIDTSDEG